MTRTTVMLPDDVFARLRHELHRRGTSLAELVREAVDKDLAEPQPRKPLAFFAVGEGPTDGSERVDDYVAGAIRKRSRQRR